MDVVHDSLEVLARILTSWRPDGLLCTVGHNAGMPATDLDPAEWYERHFETNVIGPMRLLEAWLIALDDLPLGPAHFVAISSNSAGVPRSGSAAYCASKAALSMALRVKARENRGERCIIYGYEPGLVAGTPMTDAVASRFAGPLTRMRPEVLAHGMPPDALAKMVVASLRLGAELNGCLFRLDADEA